MRASVTVNLIMCLWWPRREVAVKAFITVILIYIYITYIGAYCIYRPTLYSIITDVRRYTIQVVYLSEVEVHNSRKVIISTNCLLILLSQDHLNKLRFYINIRKYSMKYMYDNNLYIVWFVIV